jgi:hypothetical protein
VLLVLVLLVLLLLLSKEKKRRLTPRNLPGALHGNQTAASLATKRTQ